MTKPSFGAYNYIGSGTTGQPNSTVLGRIGQFIFAGLSGVGTNAPYSVQWCALGDATDWPTPGTSDARTKQAGVQVLSARYGKVTGIAGGDFFGYIFQQNAITKATYVGGDIVFAFDTFEVTRGCVDYNRFAQIRETQCIYQSEFGYHLLSNDQITDIGFGRVDDSYQPKVNTEQADVVHNPAIHTVFFGEDTITNKLRNNNNDGSTGYALTYNYLTDQWTDVAGLDKDAEDTENPQVWCLYSIDDKDGIIGQARRSGQVADVTDSSGGAPLVAVIETADANLNPGGRATVDSFRLNSSATPTTISLNVKGSLGGSYSAEVSSTKNSRSDAYHFRSSSSAGSDGRYHKLYMAVPGGFTSISGGEFSFIPAGDY